MPRHRRTARRGSGLLTFTICCAVALALLFTASNAMSQAAGQTAAAPENPFSRWFRLPSTTAAPAATAPVATQPAQRVRKPRIAKARKRSKPVAAAPQPAPVAEQIAPQPEEPAPQPEQHVADSGWPNAEANLGTAMMTRLTIKTVREQLEPEPETLLVSENELSEIDRAAAPALAATASRAPSASTDGSGAIENDLEQAHVFAMGETMKAMMQSAWLEPALLMLAGALAGLAASRLIV